MSGRSSHSRNVPVTCLGNPLTSAAFDCRRKAIDRERQSGETVFPEINPDRYTRPQGMHITMVTSASSDDEARQLLRAMGMPLKKDGE